MKITVEELRKTYPVKFLYQKEFTDEYSLREINVAETFCVRGSSLETAFSLAASEANSLHDFRTAVKECRPKWGFFTSRNEVLKDLHDALISNKAAFDVEVKRLNPETEIEFIGNVKTLLKVGDKLHVALSEANYLSRGIHTLEISEVKLLAWCEDPLKYTVEYIAKTDEGCTFVVYTDKADHEFYTYQSYWNVFKDENDAVKFMMDLNTQVISQLLHENTVSFKIRNF